jgi:hypothetical protein
MKSKFFFLCFVLLLFLGNTNSYAKNFNTKKQISSKSFQKKQVVNNADSNKTPLLIVLIDVDSEEDLQEEKNDLQNKPSFDKSLSKLSTHSLKKTYYLHNKQKLNSFQNVFCHFSIPLYLTFQTLRI